MAIMIPQKFDKDNNSYGERQVFKALQALPDDYTVFHSVRWDKRDDRSKVVYGEADFTILHPEKGLLVIEVKSGGIECVGNVWTYIRTDNGERHPMKDPLDQADKSKYRFIDVIYDLLGHTYDTDDPQYCMVASAVWFPSVKREDIIGTLPMKYHDEIVLLEGALKNPQKYIDAIYHYYNGQKSTRLSSYSSKMIVNAFAPYYCVMPSLRSKRLEQEEEFIRLTREQGALLDYLEEQRVAAIQGAAGTGKTLLALEKARRLGEERNVLFLCFNQFLRMYLQDLKDEQPDQFAHVDFYNLPQLACKKLSVPSVEPEDVLQFLENYEAYDWEYSHIVIDEGQDFNRGEIERLSDIALLQEGAFYVFYDKNQFVQGREFPDWLKNADCRMVLNINCRNTFSIADTSGRPIQVEPRVKSKSVRGDMPRFHICEDQKASIKKIGKLIDEYRRNGYAYNQICILTVKTEHASTLDGVEKITNHRIASNRGTSNILFTTARKFKGLESDAIIVIDIDANTFSSEDSKKLFYVGASRAKHNLEVVYTGSQAELTRVVQNISDSLFPTPIIGIARSLNVKPIIP